MTLKKTSWYTAIHPCRVGAHIGGRGRADSGRFLRFGFFLGAMFQLREDLLGLGDGLNNGAGEDLFEGKRTLMLIHLLWTAQGDDRRFLLAFLDKKRSERTVDEVRRVMDMMTRESGACSKASSNSDSARAARERSQCWP